MKFDLLLTLGHNSSAVLVANDGDKANIVCGYETERLTRRKSDSRFPIWAISRCMLTAGISQVNDIYVSHWSPDGKLSSMSKKHWEPEHLPPHRALISVGSTVTHHDTHAHAALWYANSKPGMKLSDTMILVIDGFGNFGEHISIYRASGWGPKLIRRFFGYGGSLGLMYQYMTAFLGMKMHEDEYKILGYEVHINEVDVDRGLLHELINKEISRYLDGYFDDKRLLPEYDSVTRLDALPALQKNLIDRWIEVAKALDLPHSMASKTIEPSFQNRVVMGYYVQSVLEGVVGALINVYRPKNLICSGGVFYNVKLNRKILDMIDGKICVYPLAGDQGNALGLYTIGNDLQWPGHLNWGVRQSPRDGNTLLNCHPRMHFTTDLNKAAEICQQEIRNNGKVNLIRGAMEFGPRALCNTSTIGLPRPAIVSQINKANGRNTVMPMAPVMTRAEYQHRMLMTHRVHLSEEHMIVALPYKRGYEVDVLGAAHNYGFEYTGRPQVLDDDLLMNQLFMESLILINTSYNVHGAPIVYTYDDAVNDHLKQNEVLPITTVYLEE